MQRDVEQADRMVARLGELLREALRPDQAQLIPLAEELAFLRAYLEIEEVRFGDRLCISWNIDPGIRNALVPSFVLQPLVENAIRHGLAPRRVEGLLEIRAEASGGSLHLQLRDNGVGLHGGSKTQGMGVGLANTRELSLENVFAGARAQFAAAVGGTQNDEPGIVMHSGLMADEVYAADNFTSRRELDTRTIDYSGLFAASEFSFRYLQRARAEALNAIDLYAGSARAGNARHAELYSIAAFSELMLAENFCSGVPLSRITTAGTEYGQPLTTTQLYDQAIADFDRAIQTAGTNARHVQIATLGKARALLDKGEFAAAAQAAATIPDNFAPYLVEYDASSARSQNAIFQMMNGEKRFGASRSEGTVNKGLPYDNPRTPITTTPVTGNGGFPTFLQLKYSDVGADIPLPTVFEARYIQAEAALRANNIPEFERLLNAARARQNLPAFTSAQIGTTQNARIDTLFRERAYAMWLTGHRFSDLRRLIRQYGRSENEVFPTGTTVYNAAYGNSVSMPIPYNEINNPNFRGCLDTGA